MRERRRAERHRRREARLAEVRGEEAEAVDWMDFPSVCQEFTPPDAILDLEADVVGMRASPDSGFLYVNVLEWAQGGERRRQALQCWVVDLTEYRNG